MIRNKLISLKECVNGLIFKFIVVSMLRQRRERKIIVYVMIVVLFRLYVKGYYDYGLITAFAEEINKEEQPKEVGMFTWWQKILIISSLIVAVTLAIKWGISVEERLSKIDQIPTLKQTARTMNVLGEKIVDEVSLFEGKITEAVDKQSVIVINTYENLNNVVRDIDALNQVLDEHAVEITKHSNILAKIKK